LIICPGHHSGALYFYTVIKILNVLLISFFCLSILPLAAQTYVNIEEYADSVLPEIYLDSTVISIFTDSSITIDSVIPAKPVLHFSSASYEQMLKEADSLGRPYFLEFYASWCGPCKLMEKEIFGDERVINYANNHYFAKRIDVDDFDGIPIVQQYKVTSLPTVILFNCNGTVKRRIEGMYIADYFLQALKSVR